MTIFDGAFAKVTDPVDVVRGFVTLPQVISYFLKVALFFSVGAVEIVTLIVEYPTIHLVEADPVFVDVAELVSSIDHVPSVGFAFEILTLKFVELIFFSVFPDIVQCRIETITYCSFGCFAQRFSSPLTIEFPVFKLIVCGLVTGFFSKKSPAPFGSFMTRRHVIGLVGVLNLYVQFDSSEAPLFGGISVIVEYVVVEIVGIVSVLEHDAEPRLTPDV